MSNIFSFLGGVAFTLFIVLAMDALAFGAWIASGQTPVDGFYFGAMTAKIISLAI